MKLKTFFFALCFCTLSSTAFSAPIVYFDFNGDALQDTSASFTLGESVTVGIYASNIDSNGLSSWGTEINFDNSQLFSNGYSIDTAWPLVSSANNTSNSLGQIEMLASSFTPQTGTVKLADIFFDTTSAGTSQLTLGEIFPASLNFSGFASGNGLDLDAQIDFAAANSEIHVSAVPIPAAIWLFGSGLITLIGFARKK